MNYTCWVGLTYTLCWSCIIGKSQHAHTQHTHTHAHPHTHTHTHTAGDGGYDYDLIVIGGGSGGLACCKEGVSLAVPPTPTPSLLAPPYPPPPSHLFFLLPLPPPTFSLSFPLPSTFTPSCLSSLPSPISASLLPPSISHSSLSFFHFPSFLPSLPLDLVPDYSELLPSFIPFFLNGTYVTLFYSTSAASFGKRVAVLDFVAPSPQGM